jgi:hypothetical protein
MWRALVIGMSLLLAAGKAGAVEIQGTVRDSAGGTATVVTESEFLPNVGDKVEFYFLSGTSEEVSLVSGRVSRAGEDSIEVETWRPRASCSRIDWRGYTRTNRSNARQRRRALHRRLQLRIVACLNMIPTARAATIAALILRAPIRGSAQPNVCRRPNVPPGPTSSPAYRDLRHAAGSRTAFRRRSRQNSLFRESKLISGPPAGPRPTQGQPPAQNDAYRRARHFAAPSSGLGH